MDHHFSGKDPKLLAIFEKIIGILDECGPVSVSFVKNAIIIAAKSTFLAVKPRKTYIDIEFLLSEEIEEFPIHKTIRVSRNKVAHFIKIEHPGEVDGSIRMWLQKAYQNNMN